MSNDVEVEETLNTLNKLNELEAKSLTKALPPRWYSLYWASYAGFILMLPAFKEPYALLIFPIVISASLVHLYMRKKGARLSIFGETKTVIFLQILFIIIGISLYLFAIRLTGEYGDNPVHILSGIICSITILVFLEYRRSLLIKKINGYSLNE